MIAAWLVAASVGAAAAPAAHDPACADVYRASEGWRRLGAPPHDAEVIRNSARVPIRMPSRASGEGEDWFEHASPKRIALCRNRGACGPSACPTEILEYVHGPAGWEVGPPSPALQRLIDERTRRPRRSDGKPAAQ